jgi:hypothetical protein
MPDFGSYLGTESLSQQQDESESTFENKSGLADDLKFLASMPELCDVTFLVGETREPVCAVKVMETLTHFHCLFLIFPPFLSPIRPRTGHSGSSITNLS